MEAMTIPTFTAGVRDFCVGVAGDPGVDVAEMDGDVGVGAKVAAPDVVSDAGTVEGFIRGSVNVACAIGEVVDDGEEPELALLISTSAPQVIEVRACEAPNV